MEKIEGGDEKDAGSHQGPAKLGKNKSLHSKGVPTREGRTVGFRREASPSFQLQHVD